MVITMVSIPQAVSTVATEGELISFRGRHDSFNTASGKYCCNFKHWRTIHTITSLVSIPQAVSTVATYDYSGNNKRIFRFVSIPQAVSTVATAGSRKPVFKRFQKVVLENLKP